MNFFYRIINFLPRFFDCVINFGFFQSLKYFFLPKRTINHLKHKNIKHKIFFRDIGDKGVISHLYTKNYKINDFKAEKKIKNIIDVGSNIGIETIRFANYFPEANIISIEANRSNFEILIKNVKEYNNIKPIHAALFNKEQKLYLGTHAKNIKADNFNETFSIQSNKDNSSEEVDAITMSQILLKNDFKNIDILKIDIEGAERYIFDESSTDWIDKVNVIIFECPDNDKDGTGITQQIYSSINLKNITFKTHICGENLILIKKDTNYFLELVKSL